MLIYFSIDKTVQFKGGWANNISIPTLKDLENAALSTWTGRMAKKNKYTNVDIDPNKLVRKPGSKNQFSFVEVEFTK